MRLSLTREQQAKARLAQEEKEALELIDKLNKADTPFAKEKIIRDELQMQKPNETILQIPKEASSEPNQ
jgi:cell division protein FtsB